MELEVEAVEKLAGVVALEFVLVVKVLVPVKLLLVVVLVDVEEAVVVELMNVQTVEVVVLVFIKLVVDILIDD